MLIHNKDDIEFVTEFPCFLGHPVYLYLLLTISISIVTYVHILYVTPMIGTGLLFVILFAWISSQDKE